MPSDVAALNAHRCLATRHRADFEDACAWTYHTLTPRERSSEIGRGELAELKAQLHEQEATMARPLPRPLTELEKYRSDPERRAWLDRQQPTKAREPETLVEQMTIPGADHPMVSHTEWRQRLGEEKARRTTR